MKLKKGAAALIAARLRSTVQDGVNPELEKALRTIVGDEDFDKVAGILGADEAPETAEDEDDGDKGKDPNPAVVAKDNDPVVAPAPKGTAMDADSIAAAVGKRIDDKYAARDAVEPLVGRIAMDGFTDATSIYAYALKQKGIACDGINEAGLKALVAMQREVKTETRQVAQDAAPTELTSRFKQA